ncbi:MAG TPA: class I SAM-dependent methyltransferase [Gaiellaceae bacterium]|nr:class I SAM-dependent methyltransferase [Gaiellaceae bacterium]
MSDALARIAALPDDWPLAGSLPPAVLTRLAAHLAARSVRRSAETGTGKSTLLFSHASARHTVFTLDDAGAGDSLRAVRESPLLRRDAVEFVVGPSQRTLPAYRFVEPLDAVLIDGAHGFPFAQLDYYHLYPHLAPGALLVLDDVHIRAVNDLFRVLRDDAMFALLEVVRTTAFFARTEAPALDPLGDGWWLQGYNRRVLPPLAGLPFAERLKALIPARVKAGFRRRRGSHLAVKGRH